MARNESLGTTIGTTRCVRSSGGRGKDLDMAAYARPFRARVEQRRQGWPWKYVWPFVEKPIRNLVWPILVAGVAVWQWVRARF